MIRDLFEHVPKHLYGVSGRVFYSGRHAFEKPSTLYVLGLNPGGCPEEMAYDTIEADLKRFRAESPSWSAYRDERWNGREYSGMQRGILGMFEELRLDPAGVPTSNVVFRRTKEQRDLGPWSEFRRLAEDCWPFHQHVVNKLQVRTIACFGAWARKWLCAELGPMRCVGQFDGGPGRQSYRLRNAGGLEVVALRHPSRNGWSAGSPVGLLKESLER